MIAAADGCRAGWAIALAESWPCRTAPRLLICPSFQVMLDATAGCQAVVVAMPIGLPTGNEHRRCDEQGRARLGGAARNRLFFAPPRPTLVADTPQEFQRLPRAITGKGAGPPVWGIVPKLREVDQAMTPSLQARVYEFHPELAWQHLAGAPLPSKHKPDGLNQRLALLRDYIPALDGITASRDGLRRRDVRLDDLLDALVGLAVAQAIVAGPDYDRRIPGSAHR